MSWAANGLNTIHAAAGGAVGGWVELGRTTLGSVGDTISVGSLSDKRYYMILADIRNDGTNNIGSEIRFNGDSGSNYAYRRSTNGGADGTGTSATFIDGLNTTTTEGEQFSVGYIANVDTEEKLMIEHNMARMATGAGTAPIRREIVGKHAQTTNPISTIAKVNTQAGSYNTGSEVVVLGWDPADTHTNNFWEELASVDLSGGAADEVSSGTITAKKYLWIQFFGEASGSIQETFRFNNDTGSNYARRMSSDGGSDSTGTNQTQLASGAGSTASPSFMTTFISNLSSKEKLTISHGISQETAGAGNAPDRRETTAKWANTSSTINRIDGYNIKPGSFDTGSEVVVLGYDPDDTHTDNFWEELASSDWSSGSSFDSGTFTAKKYLWVQGYVDSATINYHPLITVGNTTLDTGSNYAFRRSYDGNTDATATSQSSWEIEMSGTASPKFFNLFIVNNASNEKLGIMHAVAQLTAGAGTAPSRRETVCKWANTSNQINIIGLKTTTGDFASGSFIKVWGSN